MDQPNVRIASALRSTLVVSGLWGLVISVWMMVLIATASSNALLA